MKNTIIGIGLIIISIALTYFISWLGFTFKDGKHWWLVPTILISILSLCASVGGAFTVLIEKPFKTDKG
jgi:hypothetical protein